MTGFDEPVPPDNRDGHENATAFPDDDPTKPLPDDEAPPETVGVGEDPGAVPDPDETVPADQIDDPPTRGQYAVGQRRRRLTNGCTKR